MRQYSLASARPTSGRGGVRRRGRCPLIGGHSLNIGTMIDPLRGKTPPFDGRFSPNGMARNWLKQEEGPEHRIPGKAAINMRPNPKWRRFAPPVVLLGALLSAGSLATAVRAGDRHEDPEYGPPLARGRFLQGGLNLQRTGQGEGTDATGNDPIAPRDRLA